MKRTGSLFSEIASRENFKLAWLKAAKGKSGKAEVLCFHIDLNINLERVRHEFDTGKFEFGRYRYFAIHDPKERIICAASFPERIVHHAIMNILGPIFDRFLIHDSYACRPGKGTQAAVERAFRFVKANAYFLKMDVRKYFDSIDHDVLKSHLKKQIKDTRILEILSLIIDSYHKNPGKGLPIGNLTSQYFANHYLGFLDHYVKERKRFGDYLRYMDDMLFCTDTSEEICTVYDAARDFCLGELALEIKPRITGKTGLGAPFLGFIVRKDGIYLGKKSKTRFRKRWNEVKHAIEKGSLSEESAGQRISSVCSHTFIARATRFRYSVFYGRVLRRQSRESRGQLEQ